MRTKVGLMVFAMALGAVCQAAGFGVQESTKPEQYIGTWAGGWQADAQSGGFELTLEKGKDGGLAGGVSVTGDPTYKATLKSVVFDGAKMTAKYDFPPDPTLEVVLVATFESSRAKGTWSVAARDSGNQVAQGTWNVAKK